MTTSLHELGVVSERIRVLMTMTHAEAFGHVATTRQRIACGGPTAGAQLAPDRLRPDVCLEHEAGIQEARGRILAVLDRPGAADGPAETLRMIEAGR